MNSRDERLKELKKLYNDLINLTSSPLYSFRQKNHYFPVLGDGSPLAKVMFIGEAPGKNEALTGKPFSGAAGRFLEQLLNSISLKREDVYITNIVNDRPPENRDPLPKEIQLYSPFLDKQINVIQPKVIATLGRFSMRYILEKYKLPEATEAISKLHGEIIKATTPYGTVIILPLYHPAVALYGSKNKVVLFDDFKKLKSLF